MTLDLNHRSLGYFNMTCVVIGGSPRPQSARFNTIIIPLLLLLLSIYTIIILV